MGLADELRLEQENAQQCEKTRKAIDYQVKDMQTKLDEAEQMSMKGGKKITSRLEQKIRTWKPNWMMNSADLLMPKNLKDELNVVSKNLPSHKKKIIRIMNACRNWLTNFRTR